MNAEQAAGEHREDRKQETGPDQFAADEPWRRATGTPCGAHLGLDRSKNGRRLEAADLGVRRGLHVAHILEP
jgi:hypothetical protein